MSKISQPFGSSIQELWLGNGTQCYMPPTNFTIPVMCIISSSNNAPPPSDLGFSEYLGCCPENANGTNVWEYRRGCGATCYTYETALAEGMGQCVDDISKSLGNGNGTNKTWATCEFIDYQALTNGKKSAESRQETGSLVMIGGFVIISMMVLSSM